MKISTYNGKLKALIQIADPYVTLDHKFPNYSLSRPEETEKKPKTGKLQDRSINQKVAEL
jgi:hypothetical protein